VTTTGDPAPVVAHEPRRERLRALLPETIDALLVGQPVNVRYLSGFTGSNGAALVTADRTVLSTDGRYTTQAALQSPDLECVESRAPAGALVQRAVELGIERLGVEAGHVTLARHDALLAAAGGQLALAPVEPLVEPLRAVKDVAELAALRQACAITDAVFSEVVVRLRPGVTEREVSWWLACAARERGAEAMAFDSIVAFGPHSAIPHHEPSDRTLAAGDLVKLDFGARYAGYHADMTRTVVLAPAADWQRELHGRVAAIQQDLVDAAVVGAVPRELDDRARSAIEAGGHRAAHGLGHGVGLQIHEEPFATPGSPAPALLPDVAMTIEPGIYLPGQGGVRIEDTIWIRADGPVHLTTSSRELIELG
jgi:Xaa-Pro aminopeptidase